MSKRNIVLVVSALLAVAALLFALLLCVNIFLPSSYCRIIDVNWNIDMPSEAGFSETVSFKGESSFQGDGVRYHVFSYKNEEAVSNMFAWEKDTEDVRYQSDVWLDTIAVPAEIRPDYENCRYYKTSNDGMDDILFLWNPDRDEVYTVESFI